MNKQDNLRRIESYSEYDGFWKTCNYCDNGIDKDDYKKKRPIIHDINCPISVLSELWDNYSLCLDFLMRLDTYFDFSIDIDDSLKVEDPSGINALFAIITDYLRQLND